MTSYILKHIDQATSRAIKLEAARREVPIYQVIQEALARWVQVAQERGRT